MLFIIINSKAMNLRVRESMRATPCVCASVINYHTFYHSGIYEIFLSLPEQTAAAAAKGLRSVIAGDILFRVISMALT
jgi:hypothetical protein